MRKAKYVVSLFFLVAGVLLSSPVLASKKVALVIGNDQYQNVPGLNKAVNDASTIASVLSQTGFEVLQVNDASRRGISQKIHEFVSRVEPGDTAMFYYAGHGIEIDGQNYLLPVDIPAAEPGQENFVKAESIPLESVLSRLRARHAQLNIVVLDACRNNPFKSSTQRGVGSTRGLAAVSPPKGTFILYSADAGEAALDALSESDANPNSVFTRILAPLILKPDIHLAALARDVRKQVRALANTVQHEQTPAYYDAVLGDFFFASSNAQSIQKQSPETKDVFAPANLSSQNGALELAFWRDVKDSNDIDFLKSYIQQFPEGVFVYLARVKIDALQRQGQQANTVAMVSPASVSNLDNRRQLCEKHFKANRLTTGNGGNAYDCYKEILNDTPNDQLALAGIEQIENKYASWTRKYIDRGDNTRAKANIEKLRSVNPENTEIQGLVSMLETIRLIAGVYKDNGDGTVTDVRTGLQWMRCSLGQQWNGDTCIGGADSYSYTNALKEGKAKGNGWRLPEKDELLTLVYCSSGKPNKWVKTGEGCEGEYARPAVDLNAFPGMTSVPFWSASPYANYSSSAWTVHFYSGISYYYSNKRWLVRLVRSG